MMKWMIGTVATLTLVGGGVSAVAFAGSDDAESSSTTSSYTSDTTSETTSDTSSETTSDTTSDTSSDSSYAEDTSSEDGLVSLGGSSDDESSSDESYSDDSYSDESYSDDSSGDEEGVSYPLEVSAESMTEFTQNSGNPAWAGSAQDKLLSITIEFDSDGTFTLEADGVASGLVPLEGTYSESGGELSFQGDSSTGGSNGSQNLEVVGSVDVAGETMTIDWITTSGMGAVVNDTGFVTAGGASYTAELAVDVY